MKQVDKANGYLFGDLEERDIQSMMSCAVQAEFEYEKIKDVREKYMDTDTGDFDNDIWWKILKFDGRNIYWQLMEDTDIWWLILTVDERN